MKHILIVDDDKHIGDMLEEMLAKEGYKTPRAYSGTEALLFLSSCTPDLVLLDLMLPGLSGEEVLPKIRAVPVIVLSAKGDVGGKVELLLGGAVDYVTKPFEPKELLARIVVALRGAVKASGALLFFDDISLDDTAHRVSVAGQEVKLTRTEYAILKLLMQNQNQVITKSLLLDRISSDTPDCTESSLKIHVSNLRKKLRNVTGNDYVEAVWGIGFQLKTHKPG